MSIVSVGGVEYERVPVQTHLIHIKEPLDPVFDEYVKPVLHAGDWLAVSEKFVTISQGRVIHHSVVRPGLLAKILVKGVTKHPDDVGYSDPRKMQVAIMQAGWWRMLVAMIIGAISRLVLRRRGDFYRIAGHRISEIDGFSPATVKPFDEFAMLGPANPDAAAEEISAHMGGTPVVIVDADNINVQVLGRSRGVPADSSVVREILPDNPSGQNDGHTLI